MMKTFRTVLLLLLLPVAIAAFYLEAKLQPGFQDKSEDHHWQ